MTIDGEARGHAPLSVQLPLSERHQVEVTVADGVPWRKEIYLRQSKMRLDIPR